MGGLPPPPPPAPAHGPASAPPRPKRTVGASILLLLVLIAVALGGYVAAASVDPGVVPPVDVARGVRVRPAPDWQVAERAEADGITLVRLTSGSGNLDVVVGPFEGDAAALVEAYRRDVLEPDARQLEMSPERETVRLRSGLQGARGFYVGVFGERSQSIEGEVTAFVTDGGVGVAFDGWAGQGGLDVVLEDIHDMIESAELP